MGYKRGKIIAPEKVTGKNTSLAPAILAPAF
jgi:hypothetical protein